MEQIIKVSAAEYVEHLRAGDCFDSVNGKEFSICYEVDGKQIEGGFSGKLPAYMMAQTVARMLDIMVVVKQDGKMRQRFYGHDGQ